MTTTESRASEPTRRNILGYRLQMYDPAATASPLKRVVAVLIGLAVAALFLTLHPRIGADALPAVWQTTLGSSLGLTQTLQLSTGLILTGCAFAVGFRARLWNIGMEGQLFMGAWAGAAVAFGLPDLHPLPMTLLMLLAGFLGGAAWILVPALLRAYFDVSEIITTLMLNFVSLLWLVLWVTGPWRRSRGGAGTLESDAIPEAVQFGSLQFGTVAIGYGLFLAIVVAIGIGLVLRFTAFGYRLQFLASSGRTARYAGLPVRRYTTLVMLSSGGVAGLAGVTLQLDHVYRYAITLSDNVGFLGIVVGVVAAGSMLGSVVSGLFLGFLAAAGSGLRLFGVGGKVVLLLVGIILICVSLSDVLARYRLQKVDAREGLEPAMGDRPGPAARAMSDQEHKP